MRSDRSLVSLKVLKEAVNEEDTDTNSPMKNLKKLKQKRRIDEENRAD